VIESSARPKTRPPTEVARKTTKRKGRGLVEVVGIGLLVDCPLLGVTMPWPSSSYSYSLAF